MTIRKCDRCGDEINEMAVRRAYENGTIKISVVDNLHRDIDLCLDCLWHLSAWLTNTDMKEIAHGHWMRTEAYPHNIYCSVCYTTFAQEQWDVWKDGSLPRSFCPCCGAVMDEKERENDET